MLSKFVKFAEWKEGKNITPIKVARVCGDDTSSKYRDNDGCVWRLTIKDDDHAGQERIYETPFGDFAEAVKGKKANKRYYVKAEQLPNGKYQWIWKELESAPLI